MSYSFTIKAPTKAAAKEAVSAKFDSDVIAHQPVHARDRAAVLANADANIDLLADDDSRDVQVSVNGYVSWPGADTEAFTTVSIAASASLVSRAA